MRVVTYKEYEQEKMAFMKKHNYDYSIETTSMNEYGQYCKMYCFTDGANWTEVMCPTFENAEAVVRKVKVAVEVKMLRTEYYNTDASGSSYYYEKF